MCRLRVLQLVFLLCSLKSVISMKENTIMERSGSEDQQSSASSYSYQLQSGTPLNYQDVGAIQNYGYHPLALGGGYAQNVPAPLHLSSQNYLAPQQLLLAPLNSYGTPVQHHGIAAQPLQQTVALEPIQHVVPIAQPIAAGLHKYIGGVGGGAAGGLAGGAAGGLIGGASGGLIGGAGGGEQIESSNFKKGGGQQYNAQHSNQHGEKGSTGYKDQEHFEKGVKGQHGSDQASGHYDQEGASKAAAHDEGGHYSKEQVSADAAKGESFHEKKSKKKGSKTTGFHKVHHKDEYKKDHSFYDESDSSGHFNKYGDFAAKHANDEGKYAKGGHLDSGYDAKEYGTKGAEDKGKYIKEDAGFKKAQGQQSHYKEAADYAKKGEEEDQKQFGFSEGKGLKLYQ